MWRVPDCHLECLLVFFICLFAVQFQTRGCKFIAAAAADEDEFKVSHTPIQSWRHSKRILGMSDSLESHTPLVLQSHDKKFLKLSSKTVSAKPSAELKRTGSTQSPLILLNNISISVRSSNVLASGSTSAAMAPSRLPMAPIESPSSNTLPPSDSPLTSPSTGCCSENMVPRPGLSSNSCTCVYPIKLELLVENVSTTFTNWSGIFQQDLASQLDLDVRQIEITSFHLSGPNLSLAIVIGPLKDISFSVEEAETIKTDLNEFKVHFNSTLFGNYSLVQFVYYEPPLPPSAQSPIAAVSTIPRGNSLPENGSQGEGNEKKLHLWIIIAIPTVAALAILCVILLRFWLHRTKEAKTNLKGSRSISSPRSCATASIPRSITTRLFTYDELRQATNNFQPENILGEGGFGRVYKGILKDGTAVAIKRLSSGTQGDREFLVEIEMLSRLHHRNLVKLVGYNTSQDSSQHLLCYELIPNGSLEAWLHGPLGASHPLDWNTRIKIALDAARGLAYLHEDSQPCVIHRDFKASNILLENNFHAKVADFGLAKQAPEGQVNYVATQVMGTFGYVAPEYAMTGHLLVKSDVYSYGVVLLELLSGRKPVDMSQPSGQENLVTWARPLLREKERLVELADPRLFGKYPREDFAQVAAIAAACVSPEANQRPTMGEVVQSLKMLQRRSECIVTSDERPGSSDDVLPCLVHNKSFVASVRTCQQPSTGFDSDGSSSVFSSGPFNGVAFDNEVFTRSAVFSEDLHEGR